MIELIKINIKNNIKTFLITIFFIFLTNIKISQINELFNSNLYSSGVYKWYEIIIPTLPIYFILAANADLYAKNKIEYYYSLPISIEKSFIIKNVLLCTAFYLLFMPGLIKLHFLLLINIGYDSLPKGGIFLYVFENLFVLCSYSLFILIMFRELYFSLGFLIIYILFDYFTESSLLNILTLHAFTFKNFSPKVFILNRLLIFFIGSGLFIISYLILKKSKSYRKLI